MDPRVLTLENPIIFSILLGLSILGIIYIFYVHIIIPLNRKHAEEKEDLLLENAQLMALFAELDPDPVFRFNGKGEIILANKEGKNLYNEGSGNKIASIIKELDNLDFRSVIKEGKSLSFASHIGNNFYDIIIRGVPDMEFGQIYCSDITQRRRAEDELTESRKKLRELSRHIQKLQEEERQKISRDLHDNIGQLLSSIRINLLQYQNQSTGSGFDDLITLIDKTITEVKELSFRLKPSVLTDFGLTPAIKQLCEQISKENKINFSFQPHLQNERMDENLETTLYRVTQEALNNIAKHSRANEFDVHLTNDDHSVRLMIEDNGCGFDYEKIKEGTINKSSMGLINIQERILSFNGKFFVDSSDGSGTSLIIDIPINKDGKN